MVVLGLVPEAQLSRVRGEASAADPEVMTRSASELQVKRELSTHLGPATREVLAALESETFQHFLEKVTGVSDLQPDASHEFAGLHETPAGGFTLVHRDFRRHPVTKLHHRVNVLLYLNENWREEWGGCLELWPGDMKSLGRRVLPEGGTMVIWETHDRTLHGLPDPVAHPDGLSRLALASYWYTTEPRQQRVKRHDPIFARRPQDNWRVGRRKPRDVARDLLARKRRTF